MSSQSMQNQWHKAQHLHSPTKSTSLQRNCHVELQFLDVEAKIDYSCFY
jgi:hypothetical protein